VVEEDFGPIFKASGCEWVLGDNDKKLHSDVSKATILIFFRKFVVKAWAKHGIKV